MVVAVGHHFLEEVQLQQTGPPLLVVDVFTIIGLVPLVVGVGGEGAVELCAEEGEGVGGVVAVLVEGTGPEPVLRCPEEQSQSRTVVQGGTDELKLL